DLSANLFGKPMKAPLLISSMTGGPEKAERINSHLGEAAQELGLGFAVGSQRIGLEQKGDKGLNKDLRRCAPSIPLMGNLGAAQILGQEGLKNALNAVEMIEADGLYIHLNPLQEAVQIGGDTDWRGVLDALSHLVKEGIPLAVKEVGFGLSAQVVRQLMDIGVTVIDIAGAGGTNWARVEGAREVESRLSKVAANFTEWGIPTTQALVSAREVVPTATLVASGGIRTGVEAAKAIRLGADVVGQAASTLEAALTSTEAVIEHFQVMIDSLRIACFCTGSKDLKALKKAKLFENTLTD
ncbi:MAG: type 2 isopentenyl-diphosphate Delta-isomerase, partial [Pseudomonadota bacterium]